MEENNNREIKLLRQQLEDLQLEHQRLQRSVNYQIGVLVSSSLRSPRQLLRLPLNLWKLWLSVRDKRKEVMPGSQLFEQLHVQLKSFCQKQKQKKEMKPFIFIFTGTTFIQGTRGNRPIRQAQALISKGADVLFSYYRSNYSDPVPLFQNSNLLQLPQDISLQLLSEIRDADMGKTSKLFIVSYPWPGIDKEIQEFKKNNWKVIYDCRDDWEEFSKVGMARWFDPETEMELVRNCDATFCVSYPLVKKMQKYDTSKLVMLVPNATEVDFLPKTYLHEPVEPRIVGYFGHLSEAWFDWKSFIKIVENCPQFVFEVIGHSAPQGLTLPPNLYLLGPKPWFELHEYAKRWSAAVIPFKVGALADGVDPIKIYEYLSFGLPVVSFRMPQILDYPYTKIATNIEHFVELINEAMSIQVKQDVIDEFLSQNTWEVRADQLIEISNNNFF